MASILYTRGDYRLVRALFLSGVTIKAMLLKNTHTPSRAHAVVSDIVADELTVASYSRQTPAGWTQTEVQSGAVGYATAKCNPIHFGAAAAGQTAGWMALYIDNGSGDSTNDLLDCIDIPDTATDGTDFIVTSDASGTWGLGA